MAFVIADRVRETTTTIGTGSVTLGGAYTSFQTFSAAIGNGNNTYYTIASASSGEWEVGIGTYASGGNLLSRDTVLASSNAGNLVNFSVGSKDVFVTQPSERSLLINSGSTGLFAGNAAFTANGIPYANSTTTLTTGSALTFDGAVFKNTGTVNNEIALDTSSTPILSLVGGSGTIPLVGYKGVGLRFGTVTGTGAAGFSELMQLTSTGLGIGTSSPSQRLAVINNTTYQARAATATGNYTSGGMVFGGFGADASDPNYYGAVGYDHSTGKTYLRNKYFTATGGIAFQISTSGGFSDAALIDSSGNLGLGVTPSAWGGSWRALELPNGIAYTTAFGVNYQATNAFHNGTNWIYKTSSVASVYQNGPGTHSWSIAGSGTAGNAITFTQAMTLDASGNLGVGTTSPGAKVHAFNASGTNALILENGANGGVYARWKRPNREYYLALDINNNGGNDFSLYDATAAATRLTVDSSGNLGLGVTPSAWRSTTKALQSTAGAIYDFSTTGKGITQNAYLREAPNAWTYINNGPATQYDTGSGTHIWYTAPSGNAGDPITFTQAMTLTASGNLLIGTTSDVSAQTRIHAVIPTLPVNTTYEAVRVTDNTSADFKIKLTAGASTGVSNGVCVVNTAAYNMAFEVVNAERMRLDSSGNLGIGTSSPAFRLDVRSAGTFTGDAQAALYDTRSVAANIGGGLFFGGTFTGSTLTTWASINGLKENATDGNFAGYLAFYTRPNGSGASERMRLDSSGNLGLGVTPSAWGGSGVKAFDVGTGASFAGSGSDAGMIANAYYNGSNWIYKASSLAVRYQQLIGTGAHAWYTAPSGNAGDAISFTQAMTLDASGQLLVGRTSGVYRLDVAHASAGEIARFSYTGGSKSPYIATIAQSDTVMFLDAQNSDNTVALGIRVSGAERARITSGGYFKASDTGTYQNSTGSYHEIRQSTNTDTVYISNAHVTDPYGVGIAFVNATPNGTGNSFLYCSDATANRLTVRSNGGIANYSGNDVNLSDRREKTNFAPAKSYLDTICAIPVQTFNYIDQSEDDHGLTLGVVAQDVQAVAPELVMESNWGTEEDPKIRLSIYQTDLQYALMKCIQELKAEVDSLKAQFKGA